MNKRILFYLILTFLRCCAPAGYAQNLFVKVGATYGVSAADDNKRVSDFFASGQDTLPTTTGKATLYWAWQRWKAEGMPYATFRSRYLGCAIAKDVAWRYEAASNIKSGYQNTYAFADWTDASGHWYGNTTAQEPRGGAVGQGSFGHYDDTQTSQVFATCEFEMDDRDWWPANQTERRLFETPNSALGIPDAGSYNESIKIEGFRFTGPAIYGDGINRIGLFVGRAGECSYFNQLNSEFFQYGFVFRGGVPVTAGTLTAFFNEKIGVALLGCWGMTFSFQTISGDQNGELLGSHPGYGDQAGGRINGGLLKDEDGLHAEGATNPYRGQIALYLEGQYACNIGTISTARGFITSDAMIVENPRLQDGSPQGSTLNVGAAIGFNYRTAVHNLATGQRVQSPGDYQAFTLRHYSNGNRYVLNDVQVTPTACACPPLGFFRGNGTFDYVNCTPARTGGPVTPPAPGSWSCTAWSACSNGQQTRTCACSGDCATVPKPSESQSCTVPGPVVTATAVPKWQDAHPPSAAVDGNTGTWAHSGVSMAVGQTFTLDLGASRPTSSITFATPPGYPNDYPTTFSISTATGTTFTERVRTGGGATSIASWPVVSARYVRITCLFARGSWWGISEATVK